MQTRSDPECVLFRHIAEQGHYAGRTQPTNTRQGIYAAAPSGVLLSSINTRSADAVIRMLETALEKWRELPAEQRMLDDAQIEELKGDNRPERRYPTDGLVLRFDSRDLPREAVDWPRGWSDAMRNQGYGWFRAAEAASLVPLAREVGQQCDWPAEIVKRIALLKLVDNVRGQVTAFSADDFKAGAIRSTITAVDGDLITISIEGRTHTETEGTWSVRGFDDMHNPSNQQRGMKMHLRGSAVYDAAAERFIAFEGVAIGTRWGGTQYNGRGADLHPNGIGFAFSLASDSERVPPAYFWRYHW